MEKEQAGTPYSLTFKKRSYLDAGRQKAIGFFGFVEAAAWKRWACLFIASSNHRSIVGLQVVTSYFPSVIRLVRHRYVPQVHSGFSSSSARA